MVPIVPAEPPIHSQCARWTTNWFLQLYNLCENTTQFLNIAILLSTVHRVSLFVRTDTQIVRTVTLIVRTISQTVHTVTLTFRTVTLTIFAFTLTVYMVAVIIRMLNMTVHRVTLNVYTENQFVRTVPLNRESEAPPGPATGGYQLELHLTR